MKNFVQRQQSQIQGVLSGFDRLRLRGSLALLQSEGGVASWLGKMGLLIRGFLQHAEGLTKRLVERTKAEAVSAGRPVQYLAGMVDKERLVQKIRAEQGVAANGLIAVLSTLEMAQSYDVYCKHEDSAGTLVRRARKCLHYYFYFADERFGQTQVRLATWFPFDCHVLLNGREWLARQMDQAGIEYARRDNCFVGIGDFARAQELLSQQPRINWPRELDRVLRRVHPLHAEFFGTPLLSDRPLSYRWSSDQSEWATDLLFRDASVLAELYPSLLRRGLDTFQSPDVLRFLGHKLPAHGGIHGNYLGLVQSDLKRRHEGVRIKHRAGKNSVKMYNKQPTVLRVETTINDTRDLKSFRHKEGDPSGPLAWLPLRKSVADLPRRAELSQSSNDRYLDALSTITADTPLRQLTDKLCQPVTITHTRADGTTAPRRHRGLRPLDPADAKLLGAVSHGEFLISGFRNRDLRELLFAAPTDETDRRRQAGKVTRLLSLLKAHGLIKKIPHTQRYLLSSEGTKHIPALLALRDTSLQRLIAA